MYARGILFGKMKYELGDHASVKCPETGLEVDIEFKVKGWVGGTYNSIGGVIKDTKSGKALYELSGFWHGEMSIKDLSTGKREVLFDATNAKPSYPKSRPLSEQAPRESQKLWDVTTKALKKADQNVATTEKTRIEDEQRKEAAERGDAVWQPKLFKKAPPGDEEKLDWIIDAVVDNDAPAEKQIEQILAIAPILPGQKPGEAFVADKQLGPQQGKQQQPPQNNDGGGDLIDFGQNDAPPAKPAGNPAQSSQPAPQGLQEPLMPTKSQPGEPIRRMDSLGGEDEFVDAES
jgi:oxysterol-binding protein-related protein 8